MNKEWKGEVYDAVRLEFIKLEHHSLIEQRFYSLTEEERVEIKDLRSLLIDTTQNPTTGYNLDNRVFEVTKEGKQWKKTNTKGNGYYCDKVSMSRDFISYWEHQKKLCYTGMLLGDLYIPGDYYWYLNFCPIAHKNGSFTIPDFRDTDLWYFQMLEYADLHGLFTICAKTRQCGVTLKLVSRLLKKFWFEQYHSSKYICSDEKYVNTGWEILESYRDHLNTFTAWYRPLNPSKKRDWMQRQEMSDKSYKGLKSLLKGVTNKIDSTAVVSGKTDSAVIDEGGINKLLLETTEYLIPALKEGDITHGTLHIAGAAGNISQSKGMKEIMYNPEKYGFLGVPDLDNPNMTVGLFIPSYWSYGSCQDKYGNSLVKEAKEKIEKDAKLEKKKNFTSYQTWRSQRPVSLEDFFTSRTENIFPVDELNRHLTYLENNIKPLTVDLIRTPQIIHKLNNKPICEDFPVKRDTLKPSSICIIEPPMSNPPWGLYYAGIDTVKPIKAPHSVSLQSIYIFKAVHEIDGEFSQERLVAWYTGRENKPKETFQKCLDLIEYYNARACIENNERGFIDWMLNKNKQKYILRRNELPLNKDLILTSTINNSEYGIRTTYNFKKDILFPEVEQYVGDIISEKTYDDGRLEEIMGLTRIPDKMLIKEMIHWNPHPNSNFDRIVAFGLGLFAARLNTTRGLIVRTTRKSEEKPVNYREELRNSAFSGGIQNRLGWS